MKLLIEIEIPDSFTGCEESLLSGVGVQNFIETFYPGYESCDDIANWSDLGKILNEEEKPGDSADSLLQNEYDGDRSAAVTPYYASEVDVLIRTIEGFISSIKSIKKND